MFRSHLRRLQKDDPELDTAMGLGDLKLMMFAGAFLGWRGFLGSLFIGVWYGALWGAWAKWRGGQWPRDKAGAEERWTWTACVSRWRSGASVMPLGPFLSLGALTYLFANRWLAAYFQWLAEPQVLP